MVVGDDVIHWIAKEGADPAFGARPLRRFIQRHVETPVAKELLKGEKVPGDTLTVYVEDNEIKVK